ncbi:MAG: F0F1 ATP synthase subunit B [Salibacteraceae bacterium]
MEIVTPSLGLVFWTTLTFLLVLVILRKAAWKPILASLKEREEKIQDALDSAEKAKEEMAKLQASNEELLKEARSERDAMLRDARDMRDKIVNEAKDKAQEEADKLLANAKENIRNDKNAAIAELKNQVGVLAIEIAEKVLKEQLSNDDKQKALVDRLMDDVSLN